MKYQSFKFILYILLVLIVIVGFYFRYIGIKDNHPFWVDEFSTAAQANLLLKHGFSVFTNPQIFFEPHNVTTHFLVAGFFKVFGQKEWVARLPFVIIGSLVPLMVFILARKIYDSKTAIAAALLTTFSYFEITWSRQARAYVLVQLLILAAIFFYLKLQEKNRRVTIYLPFFALTVLAGILTHALFLIFLAALSLDIVIFHREIFKSAAKRLSTYIFLILILSLSYKTGLLTSVFRALFTSSPIKANNLWYYHSFLWREYGLITFLAILGILIGLLKKQRAVFLITIYLITHLLFLSFIFQPYVSRYLLPIFPILFIMMAYTLSNFGWNHLGNDRAKMVLSLLLTLFIIANGHKFINRPKKFYSVNHDFREIALIDYHQIYNLIKRTLIKNEKIAIIDTWSARVYWYINESYQPLYVLRWKDEKLSINGFVINRTSFVLNAEGEKIVPRNNNLKLVEDVYDLKRVIEKYPKGFMFIDDASLPKDVRDYAEKNFKKELYLDHYPLDDNPYSLWPATLYSWGIK